MAIKVEQRPPVPPTSITAVVPLKSVVACLSCKGEQFNASQRFLGNTEPVAGGVSVVTCVQCGAVYRMTYGHDGARLEQVHPELALRIAKMCRDLGLLKGRG